MRETQEDWQGFISLPRGGKSCVLVFVVCRRVTACLCVKRVDKLREGLKVITRAKHTGTD